MDCPLQRVVFQIAPHLRGWRTLCLREDPTTFKAIVLRTGHELVNYFRAPTPMAGFPGKMADASDELRERAIPEVCFESLG